MKFFRLASALIILGLLLATAGLVAGAREDVRVEARVNLIAYVDIEGKIRTMSPDGLRSNQVSPDSDEFFTWPTWSPDASQLVFSGVLSDDDGLPTISLYASDVDGGNSRVIFVGEPGVATLLAEGVVHYPLWAPNGERLAFIAGTSNGLTLFIDDLSSDPDAEHVLDNGPLWMSWAADSDRLLVHRGNDHFIVETIDEIHATKLSMESSGYRVPAWRPKSNLITFATGSARSDYIVSSATATGNKLGRFTEIRGTWPTPAFLWSPDGRFLALSESSQLVGYRGQRLFVYSTLTIIRGDDPTERGVINDPILAYFWSPDSRKLAYVTLSDTRGLLRWVLFDVEKGIRQPLIDFIPSQEQLTVFQFFDQYAYSHSAWSPDSDALVFAGSLSTEDVSASSRVHPGHEGFHVIVVSADSLAATQLIAEGFLAFWSPR